MANTREHTFVHIDDLPTQFRGDHGQPVRCYSTLLSDAGLWLTRFGLIGNLQREEVRRLSVTSECGELFIGKITARDPDRSSRTIGGDLYELYLVNANRKLI